MPDVLRQEPLDTVAEVIEARAADTNIALRFEDRVWTWAEVVEEMHAYGVMLRELVPSEPFHVGVLLDNVPEYLFIIGGATLVGGVVVGINPTRRGDELAKDIRAADCQAVITNSKSAQLLDGLDLGVATDQQLIIDADDFTPPTRGTRVAATPTAEDLLFLIFTSGSTGAPKAVRVTQGRAARAATGQMGFTADDVLYSAMPLFHGNALMSIVFPALGSGASIVLRRTFSASAFIPEVRANGCTFFSTVGRALSYILATPESPDDRDNQLKYVLAPESSPADASAFRKRFGCMVISGYGSSENAIVMVPSPGLPRDALGVPLEGLDVAIIDPDTNVECPRATFDADGRILNAPDAIGEIVGRNALDRFEGYYNNPEATAARARGGWYWSDDLGYRDADGIFYFAGRTADWLRVDAENFASGPVERILQRFPGLRGIAVFGVPDERTIDDQVMAVIEMDDGDVFDAARFDAFLAEQRDIGTKWAPRYVRLVSALPVGATNKIDKKPMREAAWNVTDPVYWRPDRQGALQLMTSDDIVELHQRFEEHGREGAVGR